MLIMAGFFIWGGIMIVGVVLVALVLIIVVFDSWANRPIKKSAPRPRYREEY